ncbi:MAG TPA: alpha/beta fold hydrolase [Opitutaceae bacterium]
MRSLPVRLCRRLLLSSLSLSVGLAGSAELARADKLELDRNVPVPENQKIPTADFFRVPLLFSPAVSPDGKTIAARVMTTGNNVGLLTYDIASRKFETLALPENEDVAYYGWLGSQRLFYFVSVDKLWGMGVFAVNLRTFPRSYPIFQYEGASIVGIPQKTPTAPLVWLSSDAANNGRDEGVVVANTSVEAGHAVNLSSSFSNWNDVLDADKTNQRHISHSYPVAPGMVSAYYTSLDGPLKFALSSENGVFSLYRLDDNKWIRTGFDLDQIDFVEPGNQPDQIFVRGPRQEGKPRALQFADAKTGQLSDVVYQDDAYDFTGGVIRDPVTEEIVGVYFERNGPAVRWFKEEYAHIQKMLDVAFPGMVVRIVNCDDQKNVFVVSVRSDRQPSIYYVVNLAAKSIGLIKSAQPWVDPKRMQPMNVLKFKTRDGHKLDAYFTLPKGATKQHPPPLVVVPHGGPWVRDDWGYDGEAQFLAARGYAVLQPNYRGSSGYDWMFPEEDLWDFVKMNQDVTDAVKLVLGSGYVDPNRVAIMGGSFGGYLALSGAESEPSLYKCGVTIAGVFDYSRFINEKKYDQYTNAAFAILKRHLGDPAKQKEKFDSISPLRHVDKVQIPFFVSGGTEDNTVDISESRSLLSELSKYKIPHEEMIVSGEGHGMYHVENQVALYDRIDAFLSKYLSPQPVIANDEAAAH